MKSFKRFILEKQQKIREKCKKKNLLKHSVQIKLKEGDPVKGTKTKIIINSILDTNIIGSVKFANYESGEETYKNLTNLDEIVEYLQRNAQRFTSAADWSYIVRDEVDMREKTKTKLPSAPEAPEEVEPEEEEVAEEEVAEEEVAEGEETEEVPEEEAGGEAEEEEEAEGPVEQTVEYE